MIHCQRRSKILFVASDAAGFALLRMPVAKGAAELGYDVHVACGGGELGVDVAESGITYHPIALARGGLNPLSELRTFLSICRLFYKIKPDLVHLVTIQPVLYGCIAARLTGIRAVVAAVTGLGYVFTENYGWRAKLLRWLVIVLYKLAFAHRNLRVIFQNPDDLEYLSGVTGLPRTKTELIRGSGADLSRYLCEPEPPGVPVVSMACRLLRDKGVFEFVAAARSLHARGVKARYWLIGAPDRNNPTSVTPEQISAWQREGVVECLGHRKDVAELYAQSHIVTLPSYREGLPKALIEAAACGRPIVTTDVPGCRYAIEANITGFLVRPRDAEHLAETIQKLIDDPELRLRMGAAGRAFAEIEYRIESVVAKHLELYKQLLTETFLVSEVSGSQK